MTGASGVTRSRPQWSPERATEVVQAHADRRGPLLPVLHALQEEFGYLDPAAVPLVANLLNLSRADVHGVVTFYRDFRSTPPAPVHVQVCRAEACQSVGAHALAEHACRVLETDFGGTSPDGTVALDQVFCLGNCALGPSAMVDGRLYGRVDPARLDQLVAGARGGDR
ncbi:MAG: formate dehydrogenase subunit gamma [Actinomycetes bacterium]